MQAISAVLHTCAVPDLRADVPSRPDRTPTSGWHRIVARSCVIIGISAAAWLAASSGSTAHADGLGSLVGDVADTAGAVVAPAVPAVRDAVAQVVTPTVTAAAPAVEAVAPVVQAAAPVVQAATPVVQAATPVVQAAAPVVQAAAPVVQAVAPVVQAAAPVVQAVAPVVQAAAPVVQAVAPVVQAAAPVVQAATPVVQAAAPIVQAAAPVIQAAAPVVQAAAPVVGALTPVTSVVVPVVSPVATTLPVVEPVDELVVPITGISATRSVDVPGQLPARPDGASGPVPSVVPTEHRAADTPSAAATVGAAAFLAPFEVRGSTITSAAAAAPQCGPTVSAPLGAPVASETGTVGVVTPQSTVRAAAPAAPAPTPLPTPVLPMPAQLSGASAAGSASDRTHPLVGTVDAAFTTPRLRLTSSPAPVADPCVSSPAEEPGNSPD